MARRLITAGDRKPEPMRALVFSYGSNLWSHQLQQRCPGAVDMGPATLEGWALGWAGQSQRRGGPVATVYPSKAAVVRGAVVALTATDLRALDVHEGEGTVYQRLPVRVRLKSGREVDTWVYVHKRQHHRGGPGPSARYVARIAAGLAEYGWGLDTLDAALDAMTAH